MAEVEVTLRRARLSDAATLVRVLRRSLASLDPMPPRRSEEEDRAFIRDVLARRDVTVAEACESLVGFIAIRETWIDLLYVDPAWTGRGIGGRLLARADMPETRLYCFRSNSRACRFYEHHGFRIAAVRSHPSGGEESLPDMLYIRRR